MKRIRCCWIPLLLICLLAGELHSEESNFVVVGYIPDYRLQGWTRKVGPLTDLIYFGMSCPTDGRFDQEAISKKNLAAVFEIKQQSECQLLFTIGGWKKSGGFPALAKDSALRFKFIQNARAFCLSNGFDGIDYDWEHPEGPQQLGAFEELLRETREEFARHKLIVTIAQAGWQNFGQSSYEIVDRGHLMSYDHDFPQATFEKTKADVERLFKAGCPRQKIILGLPFYGRNKGGSAKAYSDLHRNSAFKNTTDEVDGFAFNGTETIINKVRYAQRQQLGGLMIWELGQDITGPTSLLGTIGEQIRRK